MSPHSCLLVIAFTINEQVKCIGYTKSGMARPLGCCHCKCMAKCGWVGTPGKLSLTVHSKSTDICCVGLGSQ